MGKKFTTVKDGIHYELDVQTGELKEANVTVKVDDKDWIMFFMQAIHPYIKLTGNQMRLLAIMWQLSSYNASGCVDGNVFSNNPYFKQRVRSLGLEWSDMQINNEISRLAKSTDLIQKKARGSYMLNPRYFFKGTLVDRTKLMMSISRKCRLRAVEVNEAIENGEY